MQRTTLESRGSWERIATSDHRHRGNGYSTEDLDKLMGRVASRHLVASQVSGSRRRQVRREPTWVLCRNPSFVSRFHLRVTGVSPFHARVI